MIVENPGPDLDISPDSLAQLEFAKVVDLVIGKTQTPYGRALAGALLPLAERTGIETALQEALEAARLLEQEGPLPIGSGIDLLPHLERLQTEGLSMSPEVLRHVLAALESAAACRQCLMKNETAPTLQAFASRLAPLQALAGEIRSCIGLRGEILDSASFELADLRGRLRSERNRIKRQLEILLQDEHLQGVFQEQLITDRNGRYVLPVRVDHGGRLKGFVQDVSASGQTLYVEPAMALEGNNRVQTLVHGIAREEERILARLANSVRQARQPLAGNQAILARLDLRQAIARLTVDLDGVIPLLAETPILDLHQARHPLLVAAARSRADGSTVVPIDLRLPEECHTLIISGPNTGGKTVALKTAGLLVLMVRAGLPVPCAPGSRLFPFAPVMADIGDEQSIEASLSTFSGHLLNLRHILARADSRTLVLMDELGTGTDPGEGSALALAAVDRLRRSGARIMATTHLHIVKGYAQLESGVENAAVEFDTATLQPTYRLHYGIPGASHAFTIARRIGLPEDVLAAAEVYLGPGEREGVAIIERLQSLRAELEEELNQARQSRAAAEEDRRHSRQERSEVSARRQVLLEEARRRGTEMLAAAEEKLQALFRQVPATEISSRERAALTSSLRDLQKILPEPLTQGPQMVPAEVGVGEILYVPALGIEAVVSRIGDDRIQLEAGGKKLRQPLSALRQYQPRRFAVPQRPVTRIRDRVERRAFLPRLVLVGKRVDEALDLLGKFLDEALLHGETQLEIVHGGGQGILRNAVREFLAERREVTMFQAAPVEQGGDNVTVVELRH